MAIEKEKMEELKELINLFEDNIKQYKGKHYDEAKTRVDFIDKFFSVLGWDIANIQGYSEQYREVVREDRVEIKGKVKAPDYSFRIGGVRKFFVEAKKPSIDIKYDIEPAFQLRRYAYTAKLPLSILTDFEEFAIYDTRLKPHKTDKASSARIFYCTFKEYIKEFDFIFKTFSKEAILKGSFDKYIEDNKRKKGTSEVDKEFLKLIEKWRENLAKNIAIRNKELSIYELNYAVQKIIDRIIFLRIAEDRHMEDYGRIQKLLEAQKTLYPQLVDLFVQADVKYNSSLFDSIEDKITSGLKIDDKILKDIIKELYYPDSPYEFSVFGVEILGNIYEQFLGKTIRLTPSHQAKVEDKPEVKKAGGVYYTPKYIVDYIVKHTVGEKLKNKKPVDISNLKILDPACGSGSFLLGAYQLLLDFHLEFYTKEKNIKKALKENKIYQLKENEYRLTIEEKHNILLNNIFGVDIDTQAVEVTRLSLLLKLLEGESMESTGLLFKYTDIKLLPDLSENIKCGNSLIGSDFYETGQLSLFQDEETVRRINVFDWEKEFPEIFKQGGFDVVIGNPPYFNINTVDKEIFHYLEKSYSEIHTGYNDIMYYFIYKGINILKQNGIIGFITSNYYLGNSFAKKLRNFLRKHIVKVLNFKDSLIFSDANVHTNIIVAKKSPESDVVQFFEKLNNNILRRIDIEKDFNLCTLKRTNLSEDWVIAENRKLILLEKIKNKSIMLGDITIIEKGSSSGKNKVFTVSYEFSKKNSLESNLLRKNAKNSGIYRFFIENRNNYLIYIDKNTDIENYPNILKYLKEHKKELSERNEVRKGLYDWYRLERPRNKKVFDSAEKLIVPYRAEFNRFAYDKEQFFNDGGDIRAIVLKDGININLKLVLGILNSKLMNWYYGFIGKPKGTSREYFNEPLSKIPIHKLNLSNSVDKKNHDKMVELVDQMLEVQKKYHNTKLETEKKLFKNQIDILDNQIDQLVYELYGLNEEEIAIVEGKNG